MPRNAKLSTYSPTVGRTSARAARSEPAGARNSRTMIVIKMATTPSLNASSRDLLMRERRLPSPSRMIAIAMVLGFASPHHRLLRHHDSVPTERSSPRHSFQTWQLRHACRVCTDCLARCGHLRRGLLEELGDHPGPAGLMARADAAAAVAVEVLVERDMVAPV